MSGVIMTWKGTIMAAIMRAKNTLLIFQSARTKKYAVMEVMITSGSLRMVRLVLNALIITMKNGTI